MVHDQEGVRYVFSLLQVVLLLQQQTEVMHVAPAKHIQVVCMLLACFMPDKLLYSLCACNRTFWLPTYFTNYFMNHKKK